MRAGASGRLTPLHQYYTDTVVQDLKNVGGPEEVGDGTPQTPRWDVRASS